VVQEGGKRRASIHVAPDADDALIREKSLARLAEMGKDVSSVPAERIIVVRDKKTGHVKLINVPKLA